MKIEYLCEYISFSETVAKWIYDEFLSGIRDDLSYSDILASIRNCHKRELPIRLIALVDDICVGTVSLVVNDLKSRDYTPWLAALYVDKKFRNQGIGGHLTNRIQDIAVILGYKELFLRTEHASGYYKKLGWVFIESCHDEFSLMPDVFQCTLV